MRVALGTRMGTFLVVTLLVAGTVAAAASSAALAQPELRAAADPQTQLVQQIAAMRAEAGATSPGLIGRLHILGLLYQEAGDHAAAAAALEEARYVTRVHLGLSSIDEALLLRQQIRSEDALGRHQREWDLEQDMLSIARKHLDDIRVVPIFRDLAEDRSEVLEAVRAGRYPPEMYVGCYYGGARPRYDNVRDDRRQFADDDSNCRFGKREAVIIKLREEIQMYYADAIEAILKNGDFASQELRDLERQALSTRFFAPYLTLPSSGNATLGPTRFVGVEVGCPSATLDELLALDLVGHCLEPVFRSEGHVVANVGSWVSLVRLIAYEIRIGAPAADRANALVGLADWHLLSTSADRRHFDESTTRALEVYERAYRELQSGADAGAWTRQIFSPDLPVTLPTDEPNPFASAAAAEPSRYIDVTFDVTKYGRGERIQLLATSTGATRAEERDLIRLIEGTSFRPRSVDGEIAGAAPVALRYHLQ